MLNEDKLNLQIRKFLKLVGITSQREIEKAIREAVAEGNMDADGRVAAMVTLEIADLGLRHVIEQDLDLS
ncbi:MAG: DUF6494 family protein [Gammaproteobacteria bacterium]